MNIQGEVVRWILPGLVLRLHGGGGNSVLWTEHHWAVGWPGIYIIITIINHHDYHPHHPHHQTLSPSSPGALQRKLRPEDQGVDAARDPWQCEQQQRQRHLPQGACCWCCCSVQRIIISFSRTSTCSVKRITFSFSKTSTCSVKRIIISFSRISTSRNSWETSSTTLMVGL